MQNVDNDINDIDVQNKEEVITMKGKEIFHWVDKHGNRIDHNPALDNADSQAQSTEVVENNPPSDNVAETAVVIPEVQTMQPQIQPQSFVPQNQTFVPVPAVQNVGYGSYNPYATAYDCGVSLQQIAEVGLNLEAARELNKKMLEYSLDLQKKYYENLEKERTTATLNQLALDQKFALSATNVTKDANGNLIKPVMIDWKKMITSFIAENGLVKEKFNSSQNFLIRDSDCNRHVVINVQDLKYEFNDFVDNQYGLEVDYSELKLNKAFRQMLRQIPSVEKADLIKLSENELMFANGYLNLVSNRFYPLDGRKYFNKFSLLTDYNSTAPNPDVFDAVLADMFKDNKDSIHLAYQLIGALISPVSTLKRIYIFQGVSNGGKTRLANIIYRLLNGEGIFTFNTVSDITNDDLVKRSFSFRLAYIKDCSRHKLRDKQISYLKSFADGGRLQNSAVFKILICTNYPIVTDDNNFLEPALKNRFITLPFPAAMENSSEEVANFEEFYFEKEKDGIIKKALESFSEVLNSGGKFAVDYPINEIVEATSEIEMLDDEEICAIQQEVANVNIKKADDSYDRIKQVINEKFVFTDECKMKAEEVFYYLSYCLPNDVKDKASLGRKLSTIFNGTLKSTRNSENTFYNLAYKNSPSE